MTNRRGIDILKGAKRHWIEELMKLSGEKSENLKTLNLEELIEKVADSQCKAKINHL